MLWLTVRNQLASQNNLRYRRGVVQTDVVITEEYIVMFNSERIIGTTEYLTLYTSYRLNRCRNNWGRLYIETV